MFQNIVARFFYFAASLIVAIMIAAPASAQITAPAPSSPPAPKVDTAQQPEYHVQTIRIGNIRPEDLWDNAAIDSSSQFRGAKPLPDSLYIPEEKHLRNIRQLTFEGENAEAYLSPDGKSVSFQTRGIRPNRCDQIFMMKLDGTGVKRISTGRGRTTCSYFLPSGDRVLFSSTLAAYNGDCPPPPDTGHGYVWPIYGAYDIFVSDTNGKLKERLTQNDDYYDAEATVSPKGDRIIFTSTRSGDIDLFSMKIDGSDVEQLTDAIGYDGGAFYSPDGKQIVYRASRPTGKELLEYKALLKQHLIKPGQLEIWTMDANGSHKKQITHLGAASFAPYWHPDGKHIIFSSNYLDPKGRNFDLFMIRTDGTGLERITYNDTFDSFPVFTADGKQLIFCSNRNGSHPHNTNIFIADWVE